MINRYTSKCYCDDCDRITHNGRLVPDNLGGQYVLLSDHFDKVRQAEDCLHEMVSLLYCGGNCVMGSGVDAEKIADKAWRALEVLES